MTMKTYFLLLQLCFIVICYLHKCFYVFLMFICFTMTLLEVLYFINFNFLPCVKHFFNFFK